MEDQNIWEFSAPGWYDFLGPNWVPPDDGYFGMYIKEHY